MPFLPLPPRTVARGGGRGLLVNSIHGVDTLRYVVVHSGLSCTCVTEVLSSYAIIYRLSTSNHNLSVSNVDYLTIVLYRLSTSNHNQVQLKNDLYRIVLYRLSTSNHNCLSSSLICVRIVLYRLSTSNHNFYNGN